MPQEVTIFVRGVPAAKGSVSAFPIRRRSGKLGVAITHSTRSKTWEALVREQLPERVRLTGPVEVEVTFRLPRPLSVTREQPAVRPDLDKLVRAVLDALTGLIEDDSRVVRLWAQKVYASPGDEGAEVTVRQVDSNG